MKHITGINYSAFQSSLLRGTLFVLLTMIWAGCGNGERVSQTQELAAEMGAKQIRRLTAAELSDAIQKAGEKIAAVANQAAEKDSLKLSHCASPEFLAALAPIESRLNARITLLTAKDSVNIKLFPKEEEIVKAYIFQASQSSEGMADHLQKINDTLSVYYSPVKPGNPIFKKCEDLGGSPVAIWRIALDQREVIKHLK